MRFPKTRRGIYLGHRFEAQVVPSDKRQRTCVTCGGQVRRSWVTGILHTRCRACRYLVMMYGPSIEVTRVESAVNP